MTTTVAKGTNRPAATARRNRHAQTSPLPPRPGQVDAAKEVIQYGKMTIPQLRVRAEELGLKPLKSATKGKLLDLILEAERAAKAAVRIVEAQAEQDLIPQSDDAPSGAYVPESLLELEPKGLAKATRLGAEVAKSGWQSQANGEAGGVVYATLTRGPEQIVIRWDSGVFNYEESRYMIGDRTIRPRNVSQARQFASRPPEQAKAELAKVASNKAFRRRVPAPEATKGLPFDPETTPDMEVLTAVVGRKITWQNRLTSDTETAYVTARSPWTKIVDTPESGRVLWFCSPNGGFRACRLGAIVAVGRR